MQLYLLLEMIVHDITWRIETSTKTLNAIVVFPGIK